jgi:hypothetical protein
MMTKFENPSFSVYPGASKNYRDNYDEIFGKKKDKPSAWGPDGAPKDMSDLPPPRAAQSAPVDPIQKPKKARKKKPKDEKAKKKQTKPKKKSA